MKIKFNKKAIFFTIPFFILACIYVLINKNLYYTNNLFNLPFFILSLLFITISSFLFSFKLETSEKNNKILTFIIALISIFITYIMVEILNQSNMFSIDFKRIIFNFIVILFCYLLFYSITNKINLSIAISSIIFFILAVANYVLTALRGSSLLPWDFIYLKTAANVMDNYTFSFNCYLIFPVILFILIFALTTKANYKFKKSKNNVITRIILLILVVSSLIAFYTTDIINIFDFETNLWEPVNEYRHNGFIASFVKQSKSLFNKKDSNYSLEYISEIAEPYLKNTNTSTSISENPPNIIVIMSESFSDLSVNGKIETTEDYMPYFYSLEENTIRGNTYVSIFGGFTPNSEWEFLTNNSAAFIPYRTVPYQQYIYKTSPSLAHSLKAQGYTTIALHPWYGNGYRRSIVYPLLGFDKFISLEHLENLDYIRKYPSDLSTYKKIIELYEQKEENEKLFNFTVTMQNHSGYDLPGYESNIFLTNIENCPRVEQYLSILKESDIALEYLINYFKNQDEKTIIVLFGDHQPPYLEEEFWNSFSDNSNLENTKYITPFIIWANYDIEEQYIDKISLNYLSILLCNIANVSKTPYMEFLSDVQKHLPVITGNGYIDNIGNFYSITEESNYSDLINKYKLLQYNNMFDTKNRLNQFFECN